VKLPIPYKETLAAHRRRFSRMVDKRGPPTMKRLYESLQGDLTRKLAALGPRKQTFTAQQHRVALAQVKQGLKLTERRMAGELGDISRDAQVEALHGLSSDLAMLEKTFTGADVVLPLDEAMRFQGIVAGRRESLLRMHEDSMDAWGAWNVRQVEDELTRSLMLGEQFSETIDRVDGITQEAWWQAERITRTETAFAFNAAQRDGLVAASEEIPGLAMRWVEYVDDATGEGLDDRVDIDSLMMHGQVADLGGKFTMPLTLPDGSPVPKDKEHKVKHLMGKSWAQPPNRPNDRATLVPWKSDWGIPGWRCVGGTRQPIILPAAPQYEDLTL